VNLQRPLSRRRALTAGAVGLGAAVLAGCSAAVKKTASTGPVTQAKPSTATSSSAAAGGAALAKLSEVPVGGSVVAKAADGSAVIVTQPVAGQAVAFSATCTHMGCQVAPVGKELHCPCHGSIFEAATGAVKQGPAVQPLPKIDVHVAAGEVVAGA